MKQILDFLGLAMRAGKVISGEDLVVQALRNEELHLVLVSTDGSGNIKKKAIDKSRTYHTPCFEFATREELGQAIGKETRVIIGITDKGFAKKLIAMLEE
ncbi:L7Ae/L30e/S12e/Gadd45 family ribosomal protein [Salsuginibacillus kocurii]|uniref:L7Ae/L30e/S12e/Gadd45 family ribosomal protein n=1 Tax=Salsuginibacillus kocurii TaxID=427078 RepID=UPI00036222B5|nr:ribosomal L7Ae/L30e/S12e/Gadd45 family protein [Salsuginibacillus kocurii]